MGPNIKRPLDLLLPKKHVSLWSKAYAILLDDKFHLESYMAKVGNTFPFFRSISFVLLLGSRTNRSHKSILNFLTSIYLVDSIDNVIHIVGFEIKSLINRNMPQYGLS
jgi:hypothetical protein